MSLRTDITTLRTETLAALDEVHDYYEHSVSVWRLVQQLVREGRKFNIRNNVTGNTVDQDQLSKLAQQYAVHGRGIVNETYRRKAGAIARAAIGTRIDVPAPYYSQSWQLLKEIVTTVGDSLVAKTP